MAAPVQLHFGVRGARAVAFAPLTGVEERAAPGAQALLERLAVAGDGLISGKDMRDLTVGDRDRALAGLYGDLYGMAVLADAVCAACSARYELRFDLRKLSASRAPDGSAAGTPPTVRVGDTVLRLPTAADLAGTPDTLIQRLLIDGPAPDPASAATALEAADPALELDLAGTCPECDASQAVPFSMARFLEATLRRDRAFLMREVHLIASTYRWSHAEIIALPRVERQGYARLLIAEREAASARIRRVS